MIDLLYFFLKLLDVSKKNIDSNTEVLPCPLFPVIIVVVGEKLALKKSNYKKAYVALKEGSEIQFEGIS